MTEFCCATKENIAFFIPNWANVEPGLQKRIEEFSLLWQVFEWKLANKHFSLATLERSDRFSDIFGCLLNDACQRDLEPARIYFQQRYSCGQNRERLVNGCQKANLLDGLQESGFTETNKKTARTKALFYVVFRLRNNLFHGEKAAYGYAEQDGNFQNAISVLNAALRAKQPG